MRQPVKKKELRFRRDRKVYTAAASIGASPFEGAIQTIKAIWCGSHWHCTATGEAPGPRAGDLLSVLLYEGQGERRNPVALGFQFLTALYEWCRGKEALPALGKSFQNLLQRLSLGLLSCWI